MSSSSAPSSKASKKELQAFRKALFKLGNSEMSTLAKFSEIFKEISEKMEDSQVKLTPEEKQLANAIFGVPHNLSSFPLLKLPDVPRNQILRELKEVEIVKLSFLSQTMKRIVRSANYPIETLHFHANRSSPESFQCMSTVSVGDRIFFQVVKHRPENQQVFEVIGGMEVTCEKNEAFDEEDVDFICPTGVNRKSLQDFLFRHFLETFSKVDHLNLQLHSGKLKDLDLWNVTRSIDSLNYWDFKDEKIPVEDMKFMLEEINVGQIMDIAKEVEDGFRYSAGFKTELVKIRGNASWVDLDAVINSTSSHFDFTSYGEIARSQINNILKLWITRERMENLIQLFVKNCVIIGDDDALAGIEVQSEDDETDEYMVKRCDGKLAKITLSDDEFRISVIKEEEEGDEEEGEEEAE